MGLFGKVLLLLGLYKSSVTKFWLYHDGDDYDFSASEYIKNVDKVQKEKTPQSKKNGKSSSVDKTEKQKRERSYRQKRRERMISPLAIVIVHLISPRTILMIEI